MVNPGAGAMLQETRPMRYKLYIWQTRGVVYPRAGSGLLTDESEYLNSRIRSLTRFGNILEGTLHLCRPAGRVTVNGWSVPETETTCWAGAQNILDKKGYSKIGIFDERLMSGVEYH